MSKVRVLLLSPVSVTWDVELFTTAPEYVVPSRRKTVARGPFADASSFLAQALRSNKNRTAETVEKNVRMVLRTSFTRLYPLTSSRMGPSKSAQTTHDRPD